MKTWPFACWAPATFPPTARCEFRALHLDEFTDLFTQVARLAAIEAAKTRLEERQRQSDAQRGRSPDDER